MALVPISSHIREPRTLVETRPVPPGDVRVNLIIEVRLCRLDPVTGNDIPSSSNFFSTGYVCFNCYMLRNFGQLRQLLDPKFMRLGVDTSSIPYIPIVWKIMERGLEIRRTRANDGSYSSDIWLSCEVRAVIMATEIDRASFLMRALAGLESEIESNNRRIAAVRELRIRAMLYIVEVEGGDEEETCPICLEKLKVGFEAGRMPCSHGFHADCIKKWLRQSYNCPVCRFIPTN
ncbi:hypothetical protein V6N11_006439 [Hibiscus sabdariffa]|uniref:RING-type E3 ubiquitin transferase n=1 Tax=Hibiscus sabdariffa TaxID=183260 RepID=A0ABR2RQX1_9ROSI